MVSQACKHTEPHARTCCRARWCSGRCNWCTPSCRAGPSGRRASWRGTASAPATPPGRSGRAASGVGVRAGAALGGRGALWRAVVARRAACNPPAPGRPGGTSPDCTRCSTPARSCSAQPNGDGSMHRSGTMNFLFQMERNTYVQCIALIV